MQRSTIDAVRRTAIAAAVCLSAACGGGSGGSGVTGPIPTPPRTDTVPSFAGFDIGVYPGDAAMHAWVHPASPYYWAGYYLPAPCHRDTTWSNKYAAVTSMGWGVAALYVGQQDFSQMSASAARAEQAGQELVTCSSTLLTTTQGTDEATDAVTKMRADGFPDRSVIFLDVEPVTTVTPALLQYYHAWIAGVLHDGRYRPGVYAAKANAPTLYAAALEDFRAAGSTDVPFFWIAASGNFSLTSPPTAVGLDYAKLWQGMFNVTQTWNGVSLNIDADVAWSKSPSAP
ncbi:MAG: hypothetical protein JWM41_3342 [Gemmatimonadetes bacterium]|nr:hypothetical protein [Gemmatimonadota bacterium]